MKMMNNLPAANRRFGASGASSLPSCPASAKPLYVGRHVQTNQMVKQSLILTALFFLTFESKGQVNLSGLYVDSSERFIFRLELFSNDSFKFEKIYRYGTNGFLYTGTFSKIRDTIELQINNAPYVIEYYQQMKIDSLKNKTSIFTYYKRNKPLSDSSSAKYYFDGQMIDPKWVNSDSVHPLKGIPIWINNECGSIRFSDSTGKLDFNVIDVGSINTCFGEIYPNEKGNNCYTLFLSTNFILDTSIFMWNKLLIQGDVIIPLECNRPIDYVKMKSK